MRKVDDMTLFFSEKDVFSNWYRSPFEVKGISFVCMEQFMMFCKAKLFGDEDIAGQIMLATHPRDHKALGRKVSGYDDKVWVERREGIVAHGAYAKFSQNPELKQIIISTEGTILVEASPYDKIWGAGLSETDPKILDQANWKGLNLLGFVLMRVREKLIAELSLENRARLTSEKHENPRISSGQSSFDI